MFHKLEEESITQHATSDYLDSWILKGEQEEAKSCISDHSHMYS